LKDAAVADTKDDSFGSTAKIQNGKASGCVRVDAILSLL
jgi:hypothetical protein